MMREDETMTDEEESALFDGLLYVGGTEAVCADAQSRAESEIQGGEGMTRKEAITLLKDLSISEPIENAEAIFMGISALRQQNNMVDGEELLKFLEAMKQDETRVILEVGGIPDLCETISMLDAIAKFVIEKLATNSILEGISANAEKDKS